MEMSNDAFSVRVMCAMSLPQMQSVESLTFRFCRGAAVGAWEGLLRCTPSTLQSSASLEPLSLLLRYPPLPLTKHVGIGRCSTAMAADILHACDKRRFELHFDPGAQLFVLYESHTEERVYVEPPWRLGTLLR